MNFYSQVQTFIPIRATVELQRACELSTGTASCQMPVCTHHLRQDWSLMFSAGWLQHYHGSASLNTPVSDSKHVLRPQNTPAAQRLQRKKQNSSDFFRFHELASSLIHLVL